MSHGKRSPWLASAAKGATGQTYPIRTLLDFLKVPEDRRFICLREFHAWLSMQESVPALIYGAADTLGKPLPPDAIRMDLEFNWRDDGKAEIAVIFQEQERPASTGEGTAD